MSINGNLRRDVFGQGHGHNFYPIRHIVSIMLRPRFLLYILNISKLRHSSTNIAMRDFRGQVCQTHALQSHPGYHKSNGGNFSGHVLVDYFFICGTQYVMYKGYIDKFYIYLSVCSSELCLRVPGYCSVACAFLYMVMNILIS